MHRCLPLVATLFGVLSLVAACGDDDSSSSGTGGGPPCPSTRIEEFRLNGGPDSDQPVLVCLPNPVELNSVGNAACEVVEASDNAMCDCAQDGHEEVSAGNPSVAALQEQASMLGVNWNCFCRIPLYGGGGLDNCLNTIDDMEAASMMSSTGYCYFDGVAAPPIGSPAVIEECDAPQAVRILHGSTWPSAGGLLVACQEYACEGS